MDLRKCLHCGKDISIKAKFCGFCGEKLSPVDPPSDKKSKAFFSFKQISFVIIFLTYLTFSYFNEMANLITAFYDRSIELDIILSNFQIRFIDALIPIFDCIFSAFFVGLFAYWFKGLKTWTYLLIGLLMKYWFALVMVCLLVFRGQLSGGEWLEPILWILIIQIIAVLIGSFVGVKIASKHTYVNEKDRTNFFFWGLSKKFWFIITIAYNPILQFISKLFVFYFYTASKSIFEVTNWVEFFSTGYFFGVLIVLLIPFVVFAVSLKLFFIGIQAVKNKQTKFRKFKIVTFLIVMPLLTVLIPIIRNSTWFF